MDEFPGLFTFIKNLDFICVYVDSIDLALHRNYVIQALKCKQIKQKTRSFVLSFSTPYYSSLVVRSRLGLRRVPGSKLDSTEDPPRIQGLLHATSYVMCPQTPSRWCGAEACRGSTSSGIVLDI
ncbi:hypothetical protein AVEN_223065-1 [Araneus ventricosus]|uniref:Uncharacterized protein n=1 Tax=Araneus ventricosus TaxID=182803 RepID=A0A4Y1ZTS0_ARAVE|nr:hypothetical protein AVEN_223065-1 [Araneus ventricosus]